MVKNSLLEKLAYLSFGSLAFFCVEEIIQINFGKKVEARLDLTKDGIEDKVIEEKHWLWRNTQNTEYFIGTKDGLYVRAELKKTDDGLAYLYVDKQARYMFDGKDYIIHRMK